MGVFLREENWNQPKCLQVREQINEYIHTMKYHTTVIKNELKLQMPAWKNRTNINL